jgi:hypothetical protein
VDVEARWPTALPAELDHPAGDVSARRIAYAGSQFVHQTIDGGETWQQISPDLTTNDKSKQGIPPGIFPETQDVPATLIAIAESPLERGVIWTGSNDGIVSVTRDGGRPGRT